MSSTGLINKILRFLYEEDEDKTVTPAKVRPAERLVATDPSAFQENLHRTLSRYRDVTSGRIQLINLSKLKDQLGDNWDHTAEKIHGTVHGIIERRIGPDDSYTLYDDLSYMIVFANVSEKAAQIKTALIAQEITRHVLGTEATDEFLDVRTATIQRDGDLLFEKVPDLRELAAVVEAEQKQDAAEETQPQEAWWAAVSSSNLSDELAKSLEFVYRPMWHVRQKVISAYVCVPAIGLQGGQMIAGYKILPDDHNANDILTLDITAAKRVRALFAANQKEALQQLLVLPVHFETLATSRRKLQYLATVRGLPEPLRRVLIFELVGLPDGVPGTRLDEVLMSVAPFSRSVLTRLHMSHQNFSALAVPQIHAIGFDISEIETTEKTIMKAMDEFAETAAKIKMKTYVHGVSSISLTSAAVCAGFDYINGTTVSRLSETPMGIAPFGLQELYNNAAA